jgi:voltage-gated potassium channel Kch
VLLGLFFITVGMKLDAFAVASELPLVIALTVLPVLFKFALVTALAKLFGASTGVALRTGLYLAQAGEFGFVLLALATDNQLLPMRLQSPVLASMVLSMLATPFIVMYSNRIVMRLSSTDWLMQSVAMTSIAKRAINTDKHVIIAGYGRSGQNLARLLEGEHIPYMALDLDPDRVRQAAAAGQSVVFGDAARLQSLMAAGLARASAVVVSYHDTPSAMKILHLVQAHAPKVPVIVRTIDDSDLEKLRAAGATEVVPEALEGSLMLASHALALVGVPMRRVIRVVQDQRDARYGLLRGYFHGADDDTVDELQTARLASVTLPFGRRMRGPRTGRPGPARARRDGGVLAACVGRGHQAARRRGACGGGHAGAVRAAGAPGPGRGEAARRGLGPPSLGGRRARGRWPCRFQLKGIWRTMLLRMRMAMTPPAARKSSSASAGDRWASSSMRGPRSAQTAHGVIASTLAMRAPSLNMPGSPTTDPARRIAMRLLPGGPPVTKTCSDPCPRKYMVRSVSPCLMSRSPARMSCCVR